GWSLWGGCGTAGGGAPGPWAGGRVCCCSWAPRPCCWDEFWGSGGRAGLARRQRLVRREAVQQAVAAGALEIGLAAAAVRSARRMRRVPRLRRVVVAQALAVVMADHGGALPALAPIAAGPVIARRKGAAVRLRAGQHVVPVGRVGAAVDRLALLAERRLLVDLVVGAVQVVDALRDHLALGVPPGPAPDAVARLDGVCPLRAQIGVPGMAARPSRLGQRLAMAVGALDAAEVAALSGPGAGEEERHVALLCLRSPAQTERQQRGRHAEAKGRSFVHLKLPVDVAMRAALGSDR